MKFDNPTDQITYDLIDRLQKFVNRIAARIHSFSRDLGFMKYKMTFGERDDDIYIITFPKSGTTLMQMLLYQMTTDGNMDFNHIYDVSPWIRNDVFLKRPPREFPSPRIIKSHDPYRKFDRSTKGRFIFVIRNGMDVAVSLYHQQKNYNKADLDFDKFYKKTFLDKHQMNYFRFMKAWLQNKNNLNVLYIHFEDILKDFDQTIDRIAQFCDIEITAEDRPRIKDRCSFEFMKQHEDKFGEQPPKPKERIYDQFIRKGKAGEGKKTLSELQQKEYLQLFEKELAQLVEKRR